MRVAPSAMFCGKAMAPWTLVCPWTASVPQMIGIATPLIPYQAPPLIVAMSISHVPNAVFLRICLWLAAVVTVLGVPLTYFWWRIIGFL